MHLKAFRCALSCFILGLAALAPVCAVAAEAQKPPTNKQELEQTLKNAPQKPMPGKIDPYADLPEEYIQEAQNYFHLCETTGSMYLYYNCKCLASKFLDKRIELGPKASNTSIALKISNECADATQAAGYEYKQCIQHGPMMPPEIPLEEYCSCYANTYAKLYEQGSSGGPGSRTSVNFRTQAYIMCHKPEVAKKLYHSTVQ